MSRPFDQPPGTPKPPRSGFLPAAAVMAAFLALLWTVQVADSLTHYPLLRLGIDPRTFGKIEDIATAPFIHASYEHLASNTVPLLVLGFLVALRGVGRFLGVTVVIIVISGLGVWLTAASGSDTVGASGVIFGYFGFLVARGIVERRVVDVLVAAGVALAYWSILPAMLPGNPGISWQAHAFGLLGGVTAAWLFRTRRDADRPRLGAVA